MTYTICQRCYDYAPCTFFTYHNGDREWLCNRCIRHIAHETIILYLMIAAALLVAVLYELRPA